MLYFSELQFPIWVFGTLDSVRQDFVGFYKLVKIQYVVSRIELVHLAFIIRIEETCARTNNLHSLLLLLSHNHKKLPSRSLTSSLFNLNHTFSFTHMECIENAHLSFGSQFNSPANTYNRTHSHGLSHSIRVNHRKGMNHLGPNSSDR